MKPLRYFIFFFAFLGIISGCKKNALDVYPDLEGKWNSELYTDQNGSIMEIQQPDLKSYFIKIIDGESSRDRGFAKIKNDILKIGYNDFEITRYPGYDTDGNYSFDTNAGTFIGAYAVAGPIATVSGTSVTFGWTSPPAGAIIDAKFIDYRIVSTSAWTTIACPQYVSDYTLTGLLPATTYEWRIKTTRGIHSSRYSTLQTFTTQ
jgi:hypothetical protein